MQISRESPDARMIAATPARCADSTKTPTRLGKACQEFEAILVQQLLAGSGSMFGVPGGETGDDGEQEQWTGFALQSLSGAIAKSGALGWGSLISGKLQPSPACDANTAASELARTEQEWKQTR